MPTMNEYVIKEEGQNGTVVLLDRKLVRTIKKHMRRDDEQTIFVKAITDVSLNRRAMGADIITLTLGNAKTYVWKTKHAEELAKLIEDAVCNPWAHVPAAAGQFASGPVEPTPERTAALGVIVDAMPAPTVVTMPTATVVRWDAPAPATRRT